MVAVPTLGHRQTYEAIASVNLSYSSADIIFSNIPPSYTDLVAIIFGRSDDASASWRDTRIQINSDSGANYSRTSLWGNGSTAASPRNSNEFSFYVASISAGQSSSGTFGSGICHFNSYSNTNIFKTMLFSGSRGDSVWRTVNLWRSTSAISSLRFFPNVGNFIAGTSISLYGIKAAA